VSNAKSIGTLSAEEKRVLLAQLLGQRASSSRYLCPLSPGQKALWFLHQIAPQSAAYNIAFAAHIRSSVNTLALRRAFQALLDRHPSLRTTYITRNGEPVQHIHEHLQVQFEEMDASTLSLDGLNDWVVKEYRRPFDLERGPVLRVNLFARSEEEYILLLTVHHIAFDAWSLGILLDELGVLYPAEKAGTQAVLPPLDLQYTDYVHWQANMLAGPDGERLWAYWQKQLAGELPVLDLLTDQPRQPVQTCRGASRIFKLDEKLTRQLKALAKAEGATLYTTLLAAFQTLLYRYTGQQDLVVGSPVIGRGRPEFERIVGYFVNMVVLRATLSGNLTFKAFLGQVHRTVLAALEHHDYPFPLLVERLQPTRDPTRSPFLDVTFSLKTLHFDKQGISPFVLGETAGRIKWGDLTLEPLPLAQQEGQFDLALDMFEVDSSLSAILRYNADLFDAATITRLAVHFRTLLEGIVANSEQRLLDLPLLSPAERHQLLVEWNDTRVDYPQDRCIHELFETQVQGTPDAVAVVSGDQMLSYAGLNVRANQLAHHLQALGVGPEVLVGICVERSLELMVGLLGVLKAGGAYVPLDPMYPKGRLALVLEDAQSPLLLTQSHLLEELPRHQARVVCLDADWEAISRMPHTTPPRVVTADSLAYTIYTSGSTGKPKGVQILHRAVVNFVNAMAQRPGLTKEAILLAVTTPSFDIAVLELFLPLTVGARVELVSRAVAADGIRLMKRLAASHATVMQATPATWQLLLEAGWQGEERLEIFCGGEALPRTLANQLLERGVSLWNLYGPTETTVWSTIYKVTWGKGPVPIGRPIGNTQTYLLDAHLQPVPAGVPGELHIGGVGLARGYLNRPELTAEAFIPNPFSARPGARLYRTGDMACCMPGGNIEFLGRLDHQVKIRGFRIEQQEIEAVLRQYTGVRETVVLAWEDEPGDKRLVAYIVPNDGQKPMVSALRRFLREKLPEYMVPSAFVTLEALPLMPNGKVDRRALPAPAGLCQELEATHIAPRSEIERTIAMIWQEVLRVEQVGIHDNFFDLGGHSLLLTRVYGKLQKDLNGNLSMMDLFKHPTIAALTRYLSRDLTESERSFQRSDYRVERLKEGQDRLKQLFEKAASIKAGQEIQDE
jgi:amino acid adenylation domain-containing protein